MGQEGADFELKNEPLHAKKARIKHILKIFLPVSSFQPFLLENRINKIYINVIGSDNAVVPNFCLVLFLYFLQGLSVEINRIRVKVCCAGNCQTQNVFSNLVESKICSLSNKYIISVIITFVCVAKLLNSCGLLLFSGMYLLQKLLPLFATCLEPISKHINFLFNNLNELTIIFSSYFWIYTLNPVKFCIV